MPNLYSLINEIVFAGYGFIAIESALKVWRMERGARSNRLAAYLMFCFGLWSIAFGLENAAFSIEMYTACEYGFEALLFFLPAFFLHFHYERYMEVCHMPSSPRILLIYLPAFAFLIALVMRGPLVMGEVLATQGGIWYASRSLFSIASLLLWSYIFLYFLSGYIMLRISIRKPGNSMERREVALYLRSILLLFLASGILFGILALVPEERFSILVDAISGHGFFLLCLIWLLSIRVGFRRYRYAQLSDEEQLALRMEKAGLSKRELEVVALLSQGLTAQEIADKLFISLHTAKNHIHNIYEKTGARNRVELVKLFEPPHN